MPINYDNFFRTVRFPYTNERHADFVLDFEFHYTDDFGPTLTIHNLENGPLSLPFSAYAEAVDAIRSDGTSGAAPITRPMPSQSPRSSTGPASRLMPTRVANAQQPVRTSPVVTNRQRPVEEEEQQTDYEQMPQRYTTHGIYPEQQTILTSENVVETLHVPQPRKQPSQKPKPARPPREIPPAVEIDDSDDGDVPDDEGFPQEMSLKNGAAKRAGVENGQGIKRIKKLDPVPDNG